MNGYTVTGLQTLLPQLRPMSDFPTWSLTTNLIVVVSVFLPNMRYHICTYAQSYHVRDMLISLSISVDCCKVSSEVIPNAIPHKTVPFPHNPCHGHIFSRCLSGSITGILGHCIDTSALGRAHQLGDALWGFQAFSVIPCLFTSVQEFTLAPNCPDSGSSKQANNAMTCSTSVKQLLNSLNNSL